MDQSAFDYTFNQHDYECIIRLYNGVNDIYLKPESWDDLYIEEDIFDWKLKGSIVIKSPLDTLERSSREATLLMGGDDKNLIYKFRGDGRDTLYISIFPKENMPQQVSQTQTVVFDEKYWRLELEATIYDVEDLAHSNVSNKMKRLFFWEKTFQMMMEKNVEYSTAVVGSNKSKTEIYKLNNEERSLKTGEALGELLANDDDFKKHSELYKTDMWNNGDEKTKLFYTSPSNYTFLDDFNYILSRHTSIESEKFQPCLLKFERADGKQKPKQFSLMSIQEYFKKAGVGSPGEYQIEHLFLEEYSETNSNNEPVIRKAPLKVGLDTKTDVKGEDYSQINSYQLVDHSGIDNSKFLNNRFLVSLNDKKGQFNIEIKEHKAEKYKEFFEESISNSVLTKKKDERLPLTSFIKNGYNSKYIYSPFPTEEQRITDGRNNLLKYFMFTNLAISFSLRGMTIRQTGRFFGLSKLTKNDKEFDHKLEGQYFITNVIHYFSNEKRGYYTQVVGIKTHIFDENNKLPEDDVILIS